MGQCYAKTRGAAVILHVKRVAREPKRFGEVIYDLGVVIERVRECFRVRPVTMSEARVVGCDKMVAIAEPGEERLEHSRRGGKSVQQQKHGRIFRAGLSIEDREPMYLYRAIESRILHGMFLSADLG